MAPSLPRANELSLPAAMPTMNLLSMSPLLGRWLLTPYTNTLPSLRNNKVCLSPVAIWVMPVNVAPGGATNALALPHITTVPSLLSTTL